MEEYKKRRGDRKDGWWLRDLPSMNQFMPHIYPNRADNEVYITEDIDLRPIEDYLAKKNEGRTEDRYTYFHVVSAAVAKAFVLRPKMNRFIVNHRIYMRKYLSLAFVVKKKFEDTSEEGLAFLKMDENSTLDGFHEDLVKIIHQTRRTNVKDNSTGIMDTLVKLPWPILRLVARILLFLDRHGWVPNDICKEDPNYASIFVTNLGSIGLECGYHHLSNWGTASCFVVLGKKKMVPDYDKDGNPDPHMALPIGVILDERIADGYYYSGTMALVKKLLAEPELLEDTFDTPVEYAISRS